MAMASEYLPHRIIIIKCKGKASNCATEKSGYEENVHLIQ
jgi:hypothetical protein